MGKGVVRSILSLFDHHPIVHSDDGAVLGLQLVQRVEKPHAIRAHQLPVGAAGQNLPFYSWPLKKPSRDRHHPSLAQRASAQVHGRIEVGDQLIDEFDARQRDWEIG
jgi:hypothetical protein